MEGFQMFKTQLLIEKFEILTFPYDLCYFKKVITE